MSSFADFLRAASLHAQPQQLLFVFVGADALDDARQDKTAEAGSGEALSVLMYADKTLQEVPSFAVLKDEADSLGQDWKMVFVSSLSGQDGRAPTSADAATALQRMVETIKSGSVAAFTPFSHNGDPVQFHI